MSYTKSDIPLNKVFNFRKISQEFKQETKRLVKENHELQNGKDLAEQ